MPKYICSYACDVACFADFTVAARSERAARRQIGKALREGRFKNVDVTPCWANGVNNPRVFVIGPDTGHAPAVTLSELAGDRRHLFSPHTHLCVKCGQSAADDAVENTPCTE